MASDNKNAGEPAQIRSTTGRSALGEPLSVNRAPAPDLSPWIARVYATEVNLEPDFELACSQFADTPVLRVLFRGKWTAETRDGHEVHENCALFFGPQTKPMPVSVTGSFAVLTLALKPGSVESLIGPKSVETLDRIIRYDDLYDVEWANSEQLIKWFDPAAPPDRWLSVAEKLFRQLLEFTKGAEPSPIIAAFDRAAFADPNLSIGDFIQENEIERRTFERLVKKHFGLTPKQVLRRARALDMAANLRGVADNEEAEQLALRYYDQSHLIREFSAYFGMTPKQFAQSSQPLLTISLEARQARRLEVLGRIEPEEGRPWLR
ncbi:MAG: AraC family transcriptional regulator [Erythrobacter sp.]